MKQRIYNKPSAKAAVLDPSYRSKVERNDKRDYSRKGKGKWKNTDY